MADFIYTDSSTLTFGGNPLVRNGRNNGTHFFFGLGSESSPRKTAHIKMESHVPGNNTGFEGYSCASSHFRFEQIQKLSIRANTEGCAYGLAYVARANAGTRPPISTFSAIGNVTIIPSYFNRAIDCILFTDGQAGALWYWEIDKNQNVVQSEYKFGMGQTTHVFVGINKLMMQTPPDLGVVTTNENIRVGGLYAHAGDYDMGSAVNRPALADGLDLDDPNFKLIS